MTQRQEIEKVYDMIFLQEKTKEPEEAEKAYENAMNYLRTHKMPAKIESAVSDLLFDLQAESERYGFICGFQYATRLLVGGGADVIKQE